MSRALNRSVKSQQNLRKPCLAIPARAKLSIPSLVTPGVAQHPCSSFGSDGVHSSGHGTVKRPVKQGTNKAPWVKQGAAWMQAAGKPHLVGATNRHRHIAPDGDARLFSCSRHFLIPEEAFLDAAVDVSLTECLRGGCKDCHLPGPCLHCPLKALNHKRPVFLSHRCDIVDCYLSAKVTLAASTASSSSLASGYVPVEPDIQNRPRTLLFISQRRNSCTAHSGASASILLQRTSGRECERKGAYLEIRCEHRVESTGSTFYLPKNICTVCQLWYPLRRNEAGGFYDGKPGICQTIY